MMTIIWPWDPRARWTVVPRTRRPQRFAWGRANGRPFWMPHKTAPVAPVSTGFGMSMAGAAEAMAFMARALSGPIGEMQASVMDEEFALAKAKQAEWDAAFRFKTWKLPPRV